jgi:hypothetical protein
MIRRSRLTATVARKSNRGTSTRLGGQAQAAPVVRPPTAHPRHDNRLTTAIVLGCFVLLFGALSISSLLQKSPTFDEPAHVLSGYSYLKWADWRPNPEHPPFAKIWAAIPLLAFDLKDPRPSRPHWDRILDSSLGYSTNNVAEDLLFVDNDGETLFLLAKLQIVLLGILLGAFVFVWARELFGLAAATVALLLYTFDPNVLAHSQIVHLSRCERSSVERDRSVLAKPAGEAPHREHRTLPLCLPDRLIERPR